MKDYYYSKKIDDSNWQDAYIYKIMKNIKFIII